MNESSEKQLETLLSKQFSEGLAPEEHQELQSLLASSPELRKRYLEQCQLESMLVEEPDLLEGMGVAPSLTVVESVSEPEAGQDPASGSGRLLGGIGLAAACAIALLTVMQMPSGQQEVPEGPERSISVSSTVETEQEKLANYEKTVAALPAVGSLDRPAAKSVAHADSTIRFNRDVRPVLSDNCFFCHGPDQATREANLRLDTKEGILADLPDGRRTIVPGDPDNSEFYKRIIAKEHDVIMPPPDSHKHLKPEDIKLFRDWIAQGAEWEDHWSYNKIARPEPPAHKGANAIDGFIQRKLKQNGLRQEEEADRRTLVRRVSFDLTGLAPSAEEIRSFVEDASPDAYEKMVDHFLSSPRYGEHRARFWLDAARYSDTHGYHQDGLRSIWPYRDWVVNAFNDNMPFDQFTIEQIAGDMLPNPTQSQKVATGFNRCNPTTNEGGSIAEEYAAIYALDRVEATSTVWLGLTAQCAACHDHKFDPISMKEFYQMTAFFRNTTQPIMDGNARDTPPSIKVYSDEQLSRRKELGELIKSSKSEIDTYLANISGVPDSSLWVAEDAKSAHVDAKDGKLSLAGEKGVEADGFQVSTRAGFEGIEIPLEQKQELADIGDINGDVGFALSFWVFVPGEKVDAKAEQPILGRIDKKEGNQIQGWEVGLTGGNKLYFQVYPGAKWRNVRNVTKTEFQTGAWNHVLINNKGMAIRGTIGGNKPGNFVIRINGNESKLSGKDITAAFSRSAGIRTKSPLYLGPQVPKGKETRSELKILVRDFRVFDSLLTEAEQRVLAMPMDAEAKDLKPFGDEFKMLRSMENEMVKIEKAAPITLVMEEKKDSEPFAHILLRGQYDQKGDRVSAGVPESFPALPEGGATNRLALAKWLVNPENPLPARVTVNRFWQQVFGTGIVKTSEDFGSQGEPPTHPELLDWLAAEFVESGWDTKHMFKLMLMTDTYRQGTKVRPEALKADPENRLLARSPRYRYDAEVVRDQALQTSGLLVDTVGGPGVKPYQPDGLWKVVSYVGSNTSKFKADEGDKLYRRSLYTFWKRTAPPPTMSIFDAPSRESCSVRRERTNTPLQALVLMNDPQYVEAARQLASVVLREDSDNKFAAMYQRALGALPDEGMVEMLKRTYDKILPGYVEDPEAANKLLAVGDSLVDPELDPVQLATWTIVANQVMNMDQYITRN